MLLLLLACGYGRRDDGLFTYAIADFTLLEEGRSWTWRDDGGDEDPDEDALLRGRYAGDGRVELRRGASWADAADAGALAWDTGDGLELVSLDVDGLVLDGPLRLADTAPAEGDRHEKYGWLCVTDATSDVDTYYALFDEALTFDCSGEGGEWAFSFGASVGLVRVEAAGLTLDLVAAW